MNARQKLRARHAPVLASASTSQPTNADVLLKIGQVKGAVDTFNEKVARIELELQDINSRRAFSRTLGGSTIGAEDKADRDAFVAGLRGLFHASLISDSGPDGGFTIQPSIDQAISRVLENESTLRRNARKVTVSTGAYVKIVNLGGTECGWVTEKETRAKTNGSQLAKLEIAVNEVYAQPAATQQLLDDSFMDVASEIERDIAIAFGLEENRAFFNGDGVKKPNGILTYPKQVSTAAAPSAWGKTGFTVTGDANGFVATSASLSPADCLIDLLNSLRPSYRRKATWLMNSATAGVLRKFKDNDGRHLWIESISEVTPSLFLGRPVEIDEEMPAIGAGAFPVALGDWSRAYTIVDHSVGTRVLRDNITEKPWVKFYTTKRLGGGVTDFHAYKLLKVSA